MIPTHLKDSVEQFKTQIAGSLLAAGDPGYEQARRGWNLSIDQRPALVLIAENVHDVVAGVRLAQAAGLGIAVQLSGHGIQQPAQEALLIVTSRMNSVQVDPAARTARVEAGAMWRQVLAASTPLGLAPLMGTSPDVGVAGFTLGGGIGWLARRYGLAADSVRSFDIVTPDGQLRHASSTENDDLFWALRGGGGNFGVVTGLEFSLYPVATLYGGNLTYPARLAGEALRFFRDWTRTVPRELTSSIAIGKFPSLPQVPAALRGKTEVTVRAAFTGRAEDGRALIQPWLDWQAPDSNSFREMPFAEVATIQNDPVNPTSSTAACEMFDELSDAALDLIVHHTSDPASPLLFSLLLQAGGAIAEAEASSSAIGNREASFYLVMGALVAAPEACAAPQAAIRRYQADLRPHLRGGVYLNFISGCIAQAETRQRTKDAYRAESFQRLAALKAKYDPDNLFRFSFQLGADT